MIFYSNDRAEERHLQLVYRVRDYAFDVEQRPEGGGISLLLNELQIELSEEGQLLYVWGLCPQSSWKATSDTPPAFRRATLRADIPSDLAPGQSIRINRERWSVFVNNSVGWVRIGEHNPDADCIEFADGMVACLSKGQLVNLWLKPSDLPRQ